MSNPLKAIEAALDAAAAQTRATRLLADGDADRDIFPDDPSSYSDMCSANDDTEAALPAARAALEKMRELWHPDHGTDWCVVIRDGMKEGRREAIKACSQVRTDPTVDANTYVPTFTLWDMAQESMADAILALPSEEPNP